jgi:hypothetical protein
LWAHGLASLSSDLSRLLLTRGISQHRQAARFRPARKGLFQRRDIFAAEHEIACRMALSASP